jgi:hypothetical protein
MLAPKAEGGQRCSPLVHLYGSRTRRIATENTHAPSEVLKGALQADLFIPPVSPPTVKVTFRRCHIGAITRCRFHDIHDVHTSPASPAGIGAGRKHALGASRLPSEAHYIFVCSFSSHARSNLNWTPIGQ